MKSFACIFLGGGVFNGVLGRNPNNDIKAFCVGRMRCSSHFPRTLQKKFDFMSNVTGWSVFPILIFADKVHHADISFSVIAANRGIIVRGQPRDSPLDVNLTVSSNFVITFSRNMGSPRCRLL